MLLDLTALMRRWLMEVRLSRVEGVVVIVISDFQ